MGWRVVSSLLGVVLWLGSDRAAAEANLELRAEAQRSASAMLATDLTNAIECMNPQLVAAVGGKDSAERTLARKKKEMEERGAKFEGVEVGIPEKPVMLNGREFALIPEALRI